MYLGAQIFESLLNGVLPEKTGAYDRWIQKFEQELYSTPNRVLSNDEIQNRLCGTLEVRPTKFIRFVAYSGANSPM